mmetsp:Transcript_2254/g.5645  ORF Transcript_2254/g.5645 Transcript_2254/m.5645 type:complete len:426 (-) Transcript_2254:67-1344(-)|eukprot:CAMPEP_0115611086 /NCGR_PEP_ID=MMETSP0272-20121206/20351_1 /TAXON_ID=71861 /ORGANISM="Scrippsiella trochoidea, Strain CCMP3099" /LENGTH=425 /DNA_ID=CAMNT_0003046807 /DNA_START=81 /DNA_END=1358 /DNA_ORIENTATION=-
MACILLVSIQILLLILACCVWGPVLAEVSSSESACVAEECTAFMQVNVKVKATSLISRASEESDEPYPVGRTILATNASAAAAWMVKYYENAKLLPDLPGCAIGERVGVEHELGIGGTQILIFVTASDAIGADSTGQVIDGTHTAEIEAFGNWSPLNYTSWFDNHDGFQQTTFNYSAAVDDGELVGTTFHYLDNGEEFRSNLVHFIPNTMHAIEQVVHEGQAENLGEYLYLNDCMLSSSIIGNADRFQEFQKLGASSRTWWKASFAVVDPVAAYSFAERVLGAEPGVAQYPWPPVEGCTAETVARFPESGFELHFVSSPAYEKPENSIQEFTEMVLSVRNLAAGVFDAYMYNSLIMAVKNLDPYIERLRAQTLDFLLLNVGTGEYALFMTIPGSYSIVQLRSKSVSVASPMDTRSCLQEFPIERT